MEGRNAILEVKNLKTYFYTSEGTGRAVDGVDFNVYENETFGLVGESGCGKSITSLSILKLIAPPGKIVEGEVIFKGEDLLKKNKTKMRGIRGNDISMIFQEPMTSLNPVFKVGEQIAEVYRLHQKLGREDAWERSIEMLKLVGIPEAEKRAAQYPYELSGGMRQRVMIAMALACSPGILIADEPTTALDVTIQAQILELMTRLQKEFGMSILLITHDLGVIYEMCDRVAVMYAGKIVEQTETKNLFKSPRHPYTAGLLNSLPDLYGKDEDLEAIPGYVPDSRDLPDGCTFAPRCKYARDICRTEAPALSDLGDGTLCRCLAYTGRWNGEFTLDVPKGGKE